MTDPSSTPPDRTSANDEAFFVLRDSRMLFQRRLSEIARGAGITYPPSIEALSEALGKAHDELVASSQRDGFEQAHGLTASRITLMCDNDLELGIRIDEIVKRLVDIGGNLLWRVHLRYMTLLRRPEMAQEDNPVGPDVICRGLLAMCQASGAGHEGNFTLLDRMEEQLGLQLPDLYSALNDLLASRNIEPTQMQITSSGGMPAASTKQIDPLSALQSILNQQLRGPEDGSIGFMPGTADPSSGNSASSAATLLMLQQLAARLDQLELPAALDSLAKNMSGADENQLPRTVRAKDLDLPLGKPEAIALDTLALIFEAIFSTWELPDTIKTAIGRLQIPLLKLAIFDASLFSDTKHPARRLINGMARAAIGLPRDVGRAHPVSTHLWQLASTVCETLQGDAAVLAGPLAALEAMIAERDCATLAAAQPYLPLLQEMEASAQASQVTAQWLLETEQQEMAPVIVEFLRKYWVRVMEAAYREGKETGPAWQEGQKAIVDLLWSIQPKQNPDERKRLAGLLPALLKQISAGFEQIGTPSEERNAFLDACFALQTAALRGSPSASAKLATAPQTVTGAEGRVTIELIEANGMQLRMLTLPGQTPADCSSEAAGIQEGDWLQFGMNGSEQLCGLVCWQNPQSGNVLLFNLDWGYAVVLTPAVLKQQLRNERTKVVSALAIFDLAAERALKRLAGA